VLRVYFDYFSQPSRAVVLLLRLNGIEHEEKHVAILRNQHRSAWFTKLNPFQRVPVLEHDGFVLTESVAILRYICAEFPVKPNWYPEEPKARAKVDEYLEWQHANLRTHGSMYFRNLMLGIKPANREKVKYWKDQLNNSLEMFEKYFLAEGPFINGFKQPTIADLLAICEFEQPMAAGYNFLPLYPKIETYYETVRKCFEPEYDRVHHNIWLVRKISYIFAFGRLMIDWKMPHVIGIVAVALIALRWLS